MFITLEGPEGSGKTSQLPGLAEFLRQQGYDLIATREPGGTSIGDQIRRVLFDLDNKGMNPRSEILLFQASRAQLVEEVIRPALEARKVVLCDRYVDSTLAYQGYGHKVDMQALREIVNFATGGLKPDLTIFLDVPVDEGLNRRNKGGDWNRLDDYDKEFHRRVYDGYQKLIAAEPGRWVVVNAARTPEEVAGELRSVVLERLVQCKR
ncbi:MAG TPA: dTMP kinase [Anaerolineales bacterium]|jgi:dTMP kinase|nr:dTMP kinase [Anaerolineales bacterium]